jgi:serine/threonine protein kinase
MYIDIHICICIGAVKLIDFGLAVFGDGENLIIANSVAGTPVYLAPEVLQVNKLNPKLNPKPQTLNPMMRCSESLN